MYDRRKPSSLFNPDRRDGTDRRSSPRYPTGDVAIRLSWEVGGQRGETRGALCNISRGGICLLMHEPPPRGVRVEVRLEAQPSVPAVAGAVAHVKKTRLVLPGPVLVGLRLASPCPYDFFSAALGNP
jgi:hypothetical protein